MMKINWTKIDWMKINFPGLILVSLVLTFGTSALAASDPVRDKLTRTADLAPHEVQILMTQYGEFYLKMLKLRKRPAGFTTAQHRNQISEAFRQHRTAALEHLHPNEYRKWMTVAGHALPRMVSTHAGAVGSYTFGGHVSYNPVYENAARSGLLYE